MSSIFSVSLIFFQLVPFSAPRKILTIRIGYILAEFTCRYVFRSNLKKRINTHPEGNPYKTSTECLAHNLRLRV